MFRNEIFGLDLNPGLIMCGLGSLIIGIFSSQLINYVLIGGGAILLLMGGASYLKFNLGFLTNNINLRRGVVVFMGLLYLFMNLFIKRKKNKELIWNNDLYEEYIYLRVFDGYILG
jgi:hypothetical protein